ncbi:MAG: PHP domain-containing protein [Vampirovibrionales bacterium]|nr:PHP domain-containing protein [Vampirovibrionales bacterium]
MIDLHLHTTLSDGTSSAEEIIREAIAFGLEAMAITDHDTMASLAPARAAAEGASLTLIPGIEINTVWQEGDCEVHVLGYYLDPTHAPLLALLERHRLARLTQIERMTDRIRAQTGSALAFEDVLGMASPQGCLGRPHLAKALTAAGIAPTISEAFQRYLNRRSPTYVPRQTASPHEAVEAISEAGGIAVVAHPGDLQGLDALTVELMDCGLAGLEAYHRSHRPATIEYLCSLAEQYGLIVTGGTDFHGEAVHYQSALSRLVTPSYVYDELQNEQARRQKAGFKVS